MGTVGCRALDVAGPSTGVRWTFRIDAAEGADRILFAWAQMGGHVDGHVVRPTHQAIEVPLHTYSWAAPDDAFHGWPPRGGSLLDGVYAFPSVSEYRGLGTIGIRPFGRATEIAYPRQSAGVDGLSGVNKLSALGQYSLVGRDVTVTITRGQLVARRRRLPGWSWRLVPGGVQRWEASPLLPVGRYWEWTLAIDVAGAPEQRARFRLALGEDWGTVIDPAEALAFLTEFFDQPGCYRWSSWAHALRGLDGRWRPVQQFVVHYGAPGARWGFRAAQGRLLCVAGDGGSFAAPGTVLIL